MAAGPLLDKLAAKDLAGQKSSGEVDGDDTLPLAQWGIEDMTEVHHAGVCHDNIHAAMPLEAGFQGSLDRLRGGDIDRHSGGSHACSREGLRVCQIRTARPIRWLWRVFHNQFDDSPHALASPVPGYCDTEVDARCDAASGEPIAVDADAFAAGLSAKLVEGFPGTPVHRSTVASQQSSGT